jgi:hypothetical protein
MGGREGGGVERGGEAGGGGGEACGGHGERVGEDGVTSSGSSGDTMGKE